MNNEVVKFNDANDLKMFLYKNYLSQVKNFLGDEKKALSFLSSVMSSVQRIPELLNCDPTTLINSFVTIAELKLMPSNVSGEAYVLPYKGKAQLQIGYQGWITLFYRAGVEKIYADIVREHDKFSYVNGKVYHEIDIFKSNKDRGEAIGAYATALYKGNEISIVMNKEDIMAIGEQFSKSFGSQYTPWLEKNDPGLWMWRKTVIKQLQKLLPKNETINKALQEDNKDSVISDRKINNVLSSGTDTRQLDGLKMGNLLNKQNEKQEDNGKEKTGQKDPFFNTNNS